MTVPLEVKPVNQCNWPDMERLFEARGGPHYCWCMLWRQGPPGFRNGSGSVRRNRLKSLMRGYVERNDPIGLLGYVDGAPVGWVSVAPSSLYRPLGNSALPKPGAGNVWSIVCFFIQRRFRGQGLCKRLAASAVDHAKGQGAGFVEAFPADDGSPSYRFMGRVGMFLELGFERVGKVGARRNAMLLNLSTGGFAGG